MLDERFFVTQNRYSYAIVSFT